MTSPAAELTTLSTRGAAMSSSAMSTDRHHDADHDTLQATLIYAATVSSKRLLCLSSPSSPAANETAPPKGPCSDAVGELVGDGERDRREHRQQGQQRQLAPAEDRRPR
jgi:hypothetical protein